ncbi:MAG: diguanylate cyclase [Thiobacillus sp.]|nr:diguanylate cyclase [Thiobacillus sp.]
MPARASTGAAGISLRRHFLWLLLGVSSMLAGGVGLSLWFSLQIDKESELRLLVLHAEGARDSLTRSLETYRRTVDRLAGDAQLEDLLRFGDADAQQEWARSRRALIPDLYGLALVSPHGDVLGDTTSLRVGPECRAELRAKNPLDRRLHLHRRVPGAEHVDLISAVRGGDGEILGGVFLSMRLDGLRQILVESTYDGQSLVLLDANGQTVTGSGNVSGVAREIRLALGDSGWTLVARAPVHKLAHDAQIQIVAGGATLLALVLLLGAGMLRVRRALLRDVQATRAALTALTRGEPVPPIVPHFSEFAAATGEINLLALQIQAQREQLEHLSLTDPLTGLPNRRAFETRFPQALGVADRGHAVALILLDIDHFKRINDRLGHGVGDQVLLALAQTLKTLTRQADLSARLAGDEFAILLADLDAAGVRLWHQRLVDHFSGELRAQGLDVESGLSAGHTWLQGIRQDSMHLALARADRALYEAKARGRGQLVFDTPPPDRGNAG